MPLEERKYKDINQFGEGDQAKVCVDIMHKTGAHLELSMAKDQGLSIMVSGKPDAVMKARKEIVSRLQTQVSFDWLIDFIFGLAEANPKHDGMLKWRMLFYIELDIDSQTSQKI